MISLGKTLAKTSGVNLAKQALKENPVRSAVCENSAKVLNLNNLPAYRPIGGNGLQLANSLLKEFKSEYDVKSATYVCEQIKQAKKQNQSEAVLDDLFALRRTYSKNVKKMRKDVWSEKYSSFEEYISALKSYIKQNGSYMNCNECADLMQDKFNQKGIKSNNVLLYTINSEGNRTSLAEHVFTVIGLDENSDIKNPESWGKNAIICDGWADIAMPAARGIEFYEKFFGIDSSKNSLQFSVQDKTF